jgi:hypothetical protein
MGRDSNVYRYVASDPVNYADERGLKKGESNEESIFDRIRLGKCFGPSLDCANGIPGGAGYGDLWPWDKAAYNHDLRMRDRECRTGKTWDQLDQDAIFIHARLGIDLVTATLVPSFPIEEERGPRKADSRSNPP